MLLQDVTPASLAARKSRSWECNHTSFGFGRSWNWSLQPIKSGFLGTELLNGVPVLHPLGDVPSNLS